MASFNWLAQFSATWDLLVSVPLPDPLKGRVRGMPEEDESGVPEMARPLFPLVGAGLGVCVFLPAWLLIRVPGNPAAALVAGIVLPAVLEFMTRGRNTAALASYLEARWHGASPAEALIKAPETGFEEAKSPSGMILILSIYLLKAACMGVLVAFSSPCWFIVAFAGAKAVQAQLAGVPSNAGGAPMLDVPDRYEHHHWYFAAAAMLLGGIACLPASALALALAWGMAWHFTRVCLSEIGFAGSRSILVAGAAAECALLLLGVLLLT